MAVTLESPDQVCCRVSLELGLPNVCSRLNWGYELGEEYSRSDVSFSSHPIRGYINTAGHEWCWPWSLRVLSASFLCWEVPIASFPCSIWSESHSVQSTLKRYLLEGRTEIVWSMCFNHNSNPSVRGDNLEAMQLFCFSLMFYLMLAFISGSSWWWFLISLIPWSFIIWNSSIRKSCSFSSIYSFVQSSLYITMGSWILFYCLGNNPILWLFILLFKFVLVWLLEDVLD